MSSHRATAYKCEKILFKDGVVGPGAIVVDNLGKIEKIITKDEELQKLNDWTNIVQITHGVLMPGLIDSHVHINSPGRTTWEDFPHATRAAASGGVTTVVDMPLNSLPPTTTLENLRTKVAEAKREIYVDVGFWGGVIPGNHNELLDLISAGVVGFKCFLCPSGVDEFPNVTKDDLKLALNILQNTDSVLAFHAECELDSSDHTEIYKNNPDEYQTYLDSRPPEMEYKALRLINELSGEYKKARYHIVHVSASKVAEMVSNIKSNGVSITAETCPHYLTLTAEEVPDTHTEYKCAPPVRSLTNRDELWNCILNNKLNLIVSDHSPCTPELKAGGFMKAWGGISSLQFGLSLIWTNASKYGLSLSGLSKLMSETPAKLCRLDDRKGSFEVGKDADMIVFDTEQKYVVTESIILHKNKLTPYLGMELKGKVLQTYLRGKLIYESSKFLGGPKGKLLLKTESF